MTTHRKTQNKSSASQNHSFFCKYRASAPWCSSLFAPSIKYITAKTKYHFFCKYSASAPWCIVQRWSRIWAPCLLFIFQQTRCAQKVRKSEKEENKHIFCCPPVWDISKKGQWCSLLRERLFWSSKRYILETENIISAVREKSKIWLSLVFAVNDL